MTTLRRIQPLIAVALFSPARLLQRLNAAAAQKQSRRALGKLEDHILRDIGLTRAEAEAEAARPVWDVPLHWRD
ncbi:MAG TPA: DUF1127 domain-containing protein [Tabrizicola sp.]|nr:DUF1127 domain-containing protein [Tabrizicola sp.]